jgi:hypothetical protein
MATSTSKKVVVQRFDRESVPGIVNPAAWKSGEGIELLTTSGAIIVLPWDDVKTVHFVREFSDSVPPGRRAFANRPRMDGLWIRLHFRDGDTLEGVTPNDLLQVDALGLHLLPPDSAHRAFVPRTALRSVQVLGGVGSPLRAGRRKPPAKDQIKLFEEAG